MNDRKLSRTQFCLHPWRTVGRSCWLLLMFALGLFVGVASSYGGPNADAKILLHIARVDLGRCGANNGRPSCMNVATAGQLDPHAYFVALIAADASVVGGVGAIECGISYEPQELLGVDVYGWELCADFQAPIAGPNGAWPASGSGNRVSWNTSLHCQRFQPPGSPTAVALAGYLYCVSYTPGTLSVIPSPVSHLALVSSCAAVLDTVEGGFIHRTPSHLGSIRFSQDGTEPGYNPCGIVTPVKGSTWGDIKGLFQGH